MIKKGLNPHLTSNKINQNQDYSPASTNFERESIAKSEAYSGAHTFNNPNLQVD